MPEAKRTRVPAKTTPKRSGRNDVTSPSAATAGKASPKTVQAKTPSDREQLTALINKLQVNAEALLESANRTLKRVS